MNHAKYGKKMAKSYWERVADVFARDNERLRDEISKLKEKIKKLRSKIKTPTP